MSEKRMVFTAAMVQAFLDNRKFQTRRVWPIQPGRGNDGYVEFDPKTGVASWPGESEFDNYTVKSRYQVGDLVWVAEKTLCWQGGAGGLSNFVYADDPEVPELLRDKELLKESVARINREKGEAVAGNWQWRSGRFMFKWQARLWREVTDVRAQRVQEISAYDALCEGIQLPVPKACEVSPPDEFQTWPEKKREEWINGAARAMYFARCADADNHVEAYRTLWDSLHKDHPFSSRPWVFAYTLKPVEAPR